MPKPTDTLTVTGNRYLRESQPQRAWYKPPPEIRIGWPLVTTTTATGSVQARLDRPPGPLQKKGCDSQGIATL